MLVSFFQDTFNPKIELPHAPDNFSKLHVPYANIHLHEIFRYIAAGQWEKRIDNARKGDYGKLKKSFPCFTPSGVFAFRNDNFLVKYNGIVCLDFDKVESVYNFKKQVCDIPFTYAAFYSPSLKGVKVFIKTDATPGTHERCFTQAHDYYKQLTGIASDTKCKNISRLCYVSHDQDVYLNTQSAVFEVKRRQAKVKEFVEHKNTLQEFIYEFTARAKGYPEPGNRNNFFFLFACNCNRYGIHKTEALDMLQQIAGEVDASGLKASELDNCIKNAYAHTDEHGKFSIPKL